MKYTTKRTRFFLPMLLLLASTATMAETVIIDFTVTVDYVEGSSPLVIGDGVDAHIEFNTGDMVLEDFSLPGMALFQYQGADSFGSARATAGWSFPAAPGGHSIEVLAFDNEQGAYPGNYDTLDIEVRDAAGENFGFYIVCDESEGLIDLNAEEVIDFDKLLTHASTPHALEFWARGTSQSNQDDRWKATGPVTSISASVVPVPAAAWLFGSGLLGLIGASRRKRAAA